MSHSVHVCTWNMLYELTCSINEERAEKMRQEEERIRERKEILMKKLTMLNEQRKARHSIPKAPPPPPVVELDEKAFQWQDNGEF